MVTYDSTRFTYRNGTFSADVSDLGLQATPNGLKVKSAKTNQVKSYLLARCNKDKEGEITEWVYSSSETFTKVVLFND